MFQVYGVVCCCIAYLFSSFEHDNTQGFWTAPKAVHNCHKIYSYSRHKFLDFRKDITVVVAENFLYNVLNWCAWYLYVAFMQVCGQALDIIMNLSCWPTPVFSLCFWAKIPIFNSCEEPLNINRFGWNFVEWHFVAKGKKLRGWDPRNSERFFSLPPYSAC